MITSKSLKKLGLLGSLYVSQYIPIIFFLEALPVFMRQQGMSLEGIGMLSLLALPLTVNFLWSPLIDRYGFTRWGHYRFWIICLQLIVVGASAACAWLSIEEHFTIILISIFLLCCLCSTQDIATDALAVGLLSPDERGLGNGVQRGGAYLGSVIGGGGMLLLLSQFGWTATLLAIATIMLVALIPIFQHHETLPRQRNQHSHSQNLSQSYQIPQRGSDSQFSAQAVDSRNLFSLIISYLKIFTSFFSRPGIGHWLIILVLYTVGSFMASTMFRPMLVDIGLSLAEIGFLLGIVSYTAAIFGAVTAGLLIAPLGRKRSLLLFGLLETFATVTYILAAFGVTNRVFLYFAAILVHFTGSMASTTMLTVMMDKSQLDRAGTDFTIQNSFVYLGGIGAAALSGVITEAIDYQGTFALGIVISLISLILIAKSFSQINREILNLET
ncbi:MFS transporter [Oscillatoria salina]|uniref:MFS transporter n=1 Tax=Oscillatoria salina TaxID=331517 RepID=UPI001CCD938C|nr:MFS transporter [Oscillatoria salina]MBZ8179840.1 MFS transporter [Oscillatoria salina IIICB1]